MSLSSLVILLQHVAYNKRGVISQLFLLSLEERGEKHFLVPVS